jgi:UPF0755 protein
MENVCMKKLVAIGALFFACTWVWYRWSIASVDSGNEGRSTVRIEAGSSTKQIARILQSEGIIRSPLAFRILAKRMGSDGKLQAGTFILMPSMSAREIIDALLHGKAQEIAVTIPEGFTARDIDRLLVGKGLSGTGTFLDCIQSCDLQKFSFLPSAEGLASRGGTVEGYLFPDTYFVNVDAFSAEQFLQRLLTTFRDRVADVSTDKVAASGRSLHEIITMASLIEEEAITDAERPVVAGILWKRFDQKMGLGVDATVRYILDKPTGTITAGDLNVDSPYNTRKFRGLPPGPIASPGLASISSALKPAESKYWYYLHDREGKIHYAETNEQHNLNRIQYLGKGLPAS